jgi:hypothetical protein
MTVAVSIQYPSGSFGHLIHTILSSYSPQFYGKELNFKFGHGGNNHNYPTFLPKYFNKTTFDADNYTNCLKKYQGTTEFVTMLVDSGITNDSEEFLNYVKPALRLKIHYDDWSWPIAGKLFYTRCMASVHNNPTELNEFINPDILKWSNVNEAWAIREKYFLFLRDHAFRKSWRLKKSELSIPMLDVLEYQKLFKRLSMYFTINKFDDFYYKWKDQNYHHYAFYDNTIDIWNAIKNKTSYSLNNVTDLYTQAVIYYFIWLEFNVEVPHNDFSDWFTNTDEIVIMLNKLGVIV